GSAAATRSCSPTPTAPRSAPRRRRSWGLPRRPRSAYASRVSSNEIVMWVMVGLFVFLIVFILLLGWLYPGSGADQLNWRPTRSPEVEAENEVDDITQMLEAANARRRRKGLDDLTEDALSERVRAHQREMDERRARDASGSLDDE